MGFMEHILSKIHHWYHENKRDLPWRKTTDPYKIWVSEIILQQTRVNQGFSYYLRFIEKFPSVEILANATEDEVMKAWQGLGYYSRARNLHAAAKAICENYQSKLPETYEGLLELKGIGTYTAAAIASMAFNLPHPVLDGNVYRFLSRYFGIEEPINSAKGKKAFQELAEEIMDRDNPGNHNQSLMEFGAIICTPKAQCNNCPVHEHCFAFNNNKFTELPVKLKKIAQKPRYFYYFHFEWKDTIYLQKRTKDDIWKNLYEFPLIEKSEDIPLKEFLSSVEFQQFVAKKGFTINKISKYNKHILSHQVIFATFIYIQLNEKLKMRDVIQVNKKDIYKFAVSRLIENYLIKKGLINQEK